MRRRKFSLTEMLIDAVIELADKNNHRQKEEEEIRKKFKVVIKKNWLGFTSYEFHERENPIGKEAKNEL